ncbi:MAG: cell division protein ZapA [Micavibrio aeruginosavorus]|nr:cell division protein ZapA [Micavibrio aeruginosavorus]
MAEVSVSIHGKIYGIACDDGQERRVQELAKYADMRLREIATAGAATNESHLLVLTALVLADEIFDMKLSARNQPVVEDDSLSEEDERMIVDAINHLAARIDSVADRLTKI